MDKARLFISTDDETVIQDLVDVVACGKQVKLSVADVTVMLSPPQAQRFAFRLATAYARAGRLARTHQGNYVIVEEMIG